MPVYKRYVEPEKPISREAPPPAKLVIAKKDVEPIKVADKREEKEKPVEKKPVRGKGAKYDADAE